MKRFLLTFFGSFFCLFLISQVQVQAQFTQQINPRSVTSSPTPEVATESAELASISAEEREKLERLKKEDITQPEEIEEKDEFLTLFARRPIENLTVFNFVAYSVQYSVRQGVPANTIILILLLPFLATLNVFIRHIIGLPTLELLVPIALSITLVSTGLGAGAILLVTILLASTFARMILKRIRIMQLPKMALSILVVSIFVFISLTVSATVGMLTVRQLSIFPVLLLILLGEKIVSLQLSRSPRETFFITSVTLILGIIGFMILSSELFRQSILLYPEIIFVLIPINILMGRYFGLRLTEVYRFSSLRRYVNQ